MKEKFRDNRGEYAICAINSKGEISPLPIRMRETDTKDQWKWYYPLIYCDKITSQFSEKIQFEEFVKSRFLKDFDVQNIILCSKIVEDKYVRFEAADTILVFNDPVLYANASNYSEELDEYGNSKNVVNYENPKVMRDINIFINGGYKEFLNDEYVNRVLVYSKTPLNVFDQIYNSSDEKEKNSEIIKLRKKIYDNYALYRYIHLKLNGINPINDDAKGKENMNDNLYYGEELTEEELNEIKKDAEMKNQRNRKFYSDDMQFIYDTDGIEGLVSAYGEDFYKFLAQDEEAKLLDTNKKGGR